MIQRNAIDQQTVNMPCNGSSLIKLSKDFLCELEGKKAKTITHHSTGPLQAISQLCVCVQMTILKNEL